MFLNPFRQRLRVSELLPGRVDAHCHLLPGVDDGAADEDAALGIIRAQQRAGLTGAICTPHIMARLPHNTPAHLQQVFAPFCRHAQAEAPGFHLQLAAEYMLDEQFEHHLAQPETLLRWPAPEPVAGTAGVTTGSGAAPAGATPAALLIELPQYMLPPGWADMVDAILSTGLTPVLAHPERYFRVLAEQDLLALHRRGVRFQGNLGSLCGHYGTHARELARQLRARHLCSWWGTDAHTADSIRQLPLSK